MPSSISVEQVFQKGWIPPFQDQSGAPGKQHAVLNPQPVNDITADGNPYKPAGKLQGKAALITGADSGIGRAIAILFALEGADVTLGYKPEEKEDAEATQKTISAKTDGKAKVAHAPFDLRIEENCRKLVDTHLKAHGGKLDTLILNHGTQESNTDAAIPCMQSGSTVVFDASINASIGHPKLVDYTATKGAIVGFARALHNQVVGEKGIRVNVVAPGPIWTPLIPATMTKESKEKFGQGTPIGRPGQPVEVATCFVFLAGPDSSYISGQILHPNGGVVIS